MSKTAPHLRAIVFDMDGVLLRSMHLHYQAWRQAAQSLGCRADRALIFCHEGEPGATTATYLVSRARQQQLLRRKEQLFARLKRRVRPYPGAAEALRRLAATPLRLGLVTGTSRVELRAVLPQRMLRRFHASVTGDEVRHGKPHPEAFRKICRLLRVRPAEALVIENAPFGIQAARRAGMGLIVGLTTTVAARELRGADAVFGSLRHLARQPLWRALLTRTLSMRALRRLLHA